MTPLDALLVLAIGTVLLALVCSRWHWCGVLFPLLYGVQLLALLYMSDEVRAGLAVVSALQPVVSDFTLGWSMNALSWYFGLLTIGAGLLCSIYAGGEWGRAYVAAGRSLWSLHVSIALNVAGMLLLLSAADLISLFIGWEVMSWASLLLMLQGGRAGLQAGMRYLPYAMAGAMALLAAVVLVYVNTGANGFDALHAYAATLDGSGLWLLCVLFLAGFGVKMALVPFHLWQPAAYSESPGAGAVLLASIGSRMGLFAMLLVLVKLVGMEQLARATALAGLFSLQDLVMLLAAMTILIGTFVALRQDDARYLLTWSGISQGGYMVLGLFSGDPLAAAGGLAHSFSYFSYEAGLFMVVFAVMHRTGTTDMNRLGGLVVRMPLSFVVLLMGIIGLAGLPPINGFVSKWMIYRGLLDSGQVFFFLVAVLGTLGSVLYCYKLIHNIFLGQLRLEHEKVREAPWSMTVPMLLLAGVMFASGWFPGLMMQLVAPALAWAGITAPDYGPGIIYTAGADLNMLWLVSFMLIGFAVGAIIFYAGGKAQRVHQLDNYAGGHFLTADTRYQYSNNFYPALARLIGPLYRDSFSWLESGTVSLLQFVSTAAQGIYRAVHPSLFLLATVVLVLFVWGAAG